VDQRIMQKDLAKPLFVSISDEESTRQQRNRLAGPSKEQQPEQSAQVTLGGAKSPVLGRILRIEGNYYFFVKDKESGDEVRLVVNNDTNLNCGAAKSLPSAKSGQITSERQHDRARGTTKTQPALGQRKDGTAIGSGFRTGGCTFQEGDHIKAEVSDIGTVTTLKWITATEKGTSSVTARVVGESALTGELAIPSGGPGMPKQDNPGQLNLVGPRGEYLILPVPQGSLKEEKGLLGNSRILSPDGKTLGTLYSVIADVTTGKIEYAVIRLADTAMLMPVPWADLKMDKRRGSLVLHARQFQLKPDLTAKDIQSRAPSINEKDLQTAVAPPDLRGEEAGIASVGAASPMPADISCQDCSVLRGQVQQVEGELLVLKDSVSQQEVRLHVDKETQQGQAPIHTGCAFRPGDSVEAYVTPQGHALTISMIRAAEHMELPDN
jgi:hypothetical protein